MKKKEIIQEELYTPSQYTSQKEQTKEPPMLSLPVRETGSSPSMHTLSPSSALGSASCRSKSLEDAGRLKSKDLLDTEWVDFQERAQPWSKQDSGQSLEEDENLKSKDLLDTEWIDFQHNIQDPPEAPKRVRISI